MAARLSSAQGYVAHPVLWCDPFGLKQYSQVANPALQARIDALTSNQKGQVGEDIAQEMFEGRYLRDHPRGDKYEVNGRTYIPDLTLTSNQIVEVKFVKKLDLRRQIRDGLAHAGPGNYILVTAPNTHLSRGVRKLIESGQIIHKTMPESLIERMVP
ncbi:putative toxin [Corynebacterium mayonis]|uniref:putative toxin n=1 Tax=Corynebacterium mayonis TaxID=3062461 RepID=UPI00314010F6